VPLLAPLAAALSSAIAVLAAAGIGTALGVMALTMLVGPEARQRMTVPCLRACPS